jgi:hypothetical protein
VSRRVSGASLSMGGVRVTPLEGAGASPRVVASPCPPRPCDVRCVPISQGRVSKAGSRRPRWEGPTARKRTLRGPCLHSDRPAGASRRATRSHVRERVRPGRGGGVCCGPWLGVCDCGLAGGVGVGDLGSRCPWGWAARGCLCVGLVPGRLQRARCLGVCGAPGYIQMQLS